MEKLFRTTLKQNSTDLYLINDSNEILSLSFYNNKNTLWVCDKNSIRYLPQGVNTILIDEGEEAKNLSSVEKIVKGAFDYKLGRDAHFIGVGGGVVCDITAFCASVYMRSVALSLIPTTLLAMVDASLGGKTALDLLNIKNLIGSFYPAKNIFLNINSLETLDQRQFLNGLGEVLKHSLLTKEDRLTLIMEKYPQEILKREPSLLKEIIIESLLVKKSFIEEDPNELKGIREALNLGHTFGHALESVGGLSQFNHGEAVVWGIGRALEASLKLNLISETFVKRYKNLFKTYAFNLDLKIKEKDKFIEALKHDKKNRDSKIRFVLMEGQGKYLLKALDEQFITTLI